MNLNQRQKMLALLAMGVIALFVTDKILITPLTQHWKSRSIRIAQLKERVREGGELLKRDAVLTEQWSRVTNNVLNPKKSEAEGQMLKAFDRWSRAGSVTVSSIRPQWKESDGDFKTLKCRADVAGGISGITKFLYQIERDALGVKVDSMEIQSRDTEGSQLALVIEVSGLLLNERKGGRL
jgi:hypothetical protein